MSLPSYRTNPDDDAWNAEMTWNHGVFDSNKLAELRGVAAPPGNEAKSSPSARKARAKTPGTRRSEEATSEPIPAKISPPLDMTVSSIEPSSSATKHASAVTTTR